MSKSIFVIVFGTVLLSVIINSAANWIEGPPPSPPETKVEQPEPNHGTYTVVSKYKGCDVVQWHYGALAEYKYFLHCPK